MLRRTLWLVGTAVGIAEMLSFRDFRLVRVTCRRCGQRTTPHATLQRLSLTSRWGWIQILRHFFDLYFSVRVSGSDVLQEPNSVVNGRRLQDSDHEGTAARWGQMEVPTCPACGHAPMCSPGAIRERSTTEPAVQPPSE